MEKQQFQRVNGQIRVSPVRLIGDDGTQLGIVPVAQALSMARDKGLDLVEISPNVRPPVCKIMDYSKHKYLQQKAAKEARKKQVNIEYKEIQLRPNIGDHDLNVKINKIKEVLIDGNKAKLVLRFAGREMAHTDLGFKLFDDIMKQLGPSARFESKPVMEGKFLRAVITSV